MARRGPERVQFLQTGSDAAIHWLVRTTDVPEQSFPGVEADVGARLRA